MAVQEVYQAAAQSLYAMAEVDGALVTPTAMTFNAYVNGGSVVIETCTPTAAASVMTAAIDSSDTSTFAYNQLFRGVFEFTVAGVVYKREVYFTVARIPTADACPINLNDLKGMHTRFDAALSQTSQTTDAVGRYIDPAWREIRRKLEASGIQVHTVNPQSLVDVVRYWAAVNMTFGLLAGSQDSDAVQKFFEARFREAWKDLVTISRPADLQEGVKQRGGTSQPTFRMGPDRDLDNKGIWGPFSTYGGGGPLGRTR